MVLCLLLKFLHVFVSLSVHVSMKTGISDPGGYRGVTVTSRINK